jgi:hypothetical protein
MQRPIVTIDQRYDLIAAVVTLDGKPAKISGALQPFATVALLPSGTATEFAWITVARIVANGGAFKSS